MHLNILLNLDISLAPPPYLSYISILSNNGGGLKINKYCGHIFSYIHDLSLLYRL